METLYEQLKKAGVPLDHQGSDLFALVNTKSRTIIDKYELKSNVSVFINKSDHQTWFRIPSAYSS